jgi:hypothetical protein
MGVAPDIFSPVPALKIVKASKDPGGRGMSRRAALAIFLLVSAAMAASSATEQSPASTITGVVKDSTGAVVSGARVTAVGSSGETLSAVTGDEGTFKIESVKAGHYTVAVEARGFKRFERAIDVEAGRKASIEIRLEVAAPAEEITVPGKGGGLANIDPIYRQVRDGEDFQTFSVSNLVLKRDVGTITLRTGLISFAAPANGRVVKAVFSGDGQFALVPAIPIERAYLRALTEKDTVDESFEKAVFYFTDQTSEEIKRRSTTPASSDPKAHSILGDLHDRLRRRPEHPRSMIEYLLTSEGENLDAEVLADVYNPGRGGSFNAFIFGKKYGDLRFLVRPRGALPQLLSPEEVALVNFDPGNDREGVWYLAHYEKEYRDGTASSEEDKRIIDVDRYKIETVIGGDEKLTATAGMAFTAVADGARVFALGLLPNLRVARVTLNGEDINFVQEQRKQDGSFYVIMPEPMEKGHQYQIAVEYRGDKVVEDRGGGNFAVGARTSWYPSANAFNDRATFELTFKVPKQYTLVGVGKLVKEWKEGDYSASQWVSEVPLAVAGFNYGLFKKKTLTDEATNYTIEGYATTELPADWRGTEEIGGMTPTRLTENAMVEAQNSIRIFTHWFGKAPYGRIAVTQQPQAFFGQSWPTLVYLPIIAFFDSTQRWRLMGINTRLTEFIQEVTPHEVSHQWWGHMVGWASYHDQWLSEGFADFSAGLYLQATEKTPDKYLNYWKHSREAILEKNQFGLRANDAGPIWLGLRLNTYKNPIAYSRLVYPKGGFILHMLRSMMWDKKSGDKQFTDMMHDFVESNLNQNVSTERFKRAVEKHMTPAMDLDGNRRMDWFFEEWVYGTEVPSYKIEYSLTPEQDGKFLLSASVSQSGVSPSFKMPVPIFLDFDGTIMRLGEATISGSSTTPEFKVHLPKKPKRVLINYYNDVLAQESVAVEKKH